MIQIDDKKVIEGMLTVTVGLLIVRFLFDIPVLAQVALGTGLVGLFIPFLAKWIAWTWFKISDGIGAVVSRVLLTVIFFGVLVPIAFLSRLFTKGDLQLKRKEGSYYSDRNHLYEPKDFENVW